LAALPRRSQHAATSASTWGDVALIQLRFSLPTACALALSAGLAAPAHAQADFYKGKTVTLIAGFSPGGGYDINARALSRHLGRHIPGNPNILVQNQPGAGSLSAVRNLDATLPRDGTAIVTFNPGLVTQSIVQPDIVKVNFRNIAWVGVIAADRRVCYGFGPNGVKTWADMMGRKTFILGSTAKGAGNYINGATLRVVFNAPVRQILGFPGSAEQRIAIERGELDGDCGAYASIPIAWVRDKKVHPFVRFSEEQSEIPSSAVYIGTFAKTDEQRALLNVLSGGDDIGRPYIMSKQVPADRVAILRQAFMATMKDPAFLADMKKLGHPVEPLPGDRAEAIVAKMSGASPDVLKKARAIYQ
jgi:tripartite-type tricarboxylate transporter receptor subunit TctC